MAEKKQDFVVSDRRRFGAEGELRNDSSAVEEQEKPAAPAPPPAAPSSAAGPSTAAPTAATPIAPPAESKAPEQPPEPEATPEPSEEELPPPPTAQEQQEQHDAYKASGKQMEEMFTQAAAGKARIPVEMNFERLIESFYMTALLQLGAIRQEGEPPAVDIMGARQTIDSITLLQEKTKGNLTEREQNLLQNILFELRMAWIEITNAIATGAASGPGAKTPGPVSGIKK